MPIDPATLSDSQLEEKLAIVDRMLAMFAEWEAEDESRRPLWLEREDREAMRILANWGWCDPPIYEEDIKRYARRFKVSEREAERRLRRRRGYDSR